MKEFREDLLGVFFVCTEGRFGLEVSRDASSEGSFIIRAFRHADGANQDAPLARKSAVRFEECRASFNPPSDAGSEFAPARIGSLSKTIESDYEYSVYVMFAGPPDDDEDSKFAWVAIGPDTPLAQIAAFPYYKGSYMELLTGDDWLEDYDDPDYWYSPQRRYHPVLGASEGGD